MGARRKPAPPALTLTLVEAEPKPAKPQPAVYSVYEAAKLLGRDPTALRNHMDATGWVIDGRVPALRVGPRSNDLRVPRRTLNEVLGLET